MKALRYAVPSVRRAPKVLSVHERDVRDGYRVLLLIVAVQLLALAAIAAIVFSANPA